MRPNLIVVLLSCAFLWSGLAQAQSGTASGSVSVEAKSKKAAKPKHKPQKVVEQAPVAPLVATPLPELTPELQTISDQIHTGKLPCEMGVTVTILHDAREPGRFNLFIKNHVYNLSPVQSATGAIRLEDTAQGAVWIQLADKSMLMNSHLGQRMADVCQSPAQMQVAEAHKLAPPPSLLDPLPGKGLAQR